MLFVRHTLADALPPRGGPRSSAGRSAKLALPALLLLLAVAVGPAATVSAASDPQVSIVDFAFQPATLTVTAGDTVTWSNTGMASHTTTSDTGAWDSKPIASGGTFSFRFGTPGTFAYHCAIHPTMHGVIVVLAPGQEPTAIDGRRLSGESAATQALFRAVWGDQAALEWVNEHNAAIAPQMMGPGVGAPMATTSTAPMAPAQPPTSAPAAPSAPAPAAPAPPPSGPSRY